MNFFRGISYCILIFLTINSNNIFASDANDKLYSKTKKISKMFEVVWSRSPQAAGYEAKQAEIRMFLANANKLTPAPVSLSLANINDRANAKAGKNEWEVEIGVPIWLSGQKDARIDQANFLAENFANQILLDKLALANEFRQAWWQYAEAQVKNKLANQFYDNAVASMSLVELKFKAGEVSRIDYNLAKSEAFLAKSELIAAKNSLKQAYQQLSLLTGAIEIDTKDSEEILASDKSDIDLHPSFISEQAEIKIKQNQLKILEMSTSANPELALRMIRDRANYIEKYSNYLGIKLTFPLSANPDLEQQILRIKSEIEIAEAKLLQTKSKLKLQIESSQNLLEVAEQQMAIEKLRHELLTENLKLAKKSFLLGESDFASFMRINSNAYQAEITYQKQIIQHSSAISQVNQSLGVLP